MLNFSTLAVQQTFQTYKEKHHKKIIFLYYYIYYSKLVISQ